MPWFKVDDAIHSHPKFIDLPMSAIGLWTVAGAWCAQYLTDGLITAKQLRRIGADDEDISSLVDAGLWHESSDGYSFHDWDEYQPTRESVEAERAAARERMQKRRRGKTGQFAGSSEDVRPNTQRTNAERSAEVRDLFVHPDPTRPDPSLKSAGRRSPERPLPADWSPNDAHRQQASQSNADLDREAFRFRNHAQANDRRQRDWDAAFRNWLSNAKPAPGTSKNPLWDA